MADRHYDADYKEIGIGSILRPKDNQYQRLVVVDMNTEAVLVKDLRSGNIGTINPQQYVITNAS